MGLPRGLIVFAAPFMIAIEFGEVSLGESKS